MSERRRNVQARLSEEAHAGLDAYCNRRHVTLTGLLEAMGRLLDPGDRPYPSEPDIIALARRIDRERRSRR